MNVLIGLAATLLMFAGLLLIPLGLPGLWLIVSVAVGLALLDWLPASFAVAAAGAGALAELVEFVILKVFGSAYGGSTRAFWGAVLGGMLGLFVGLPVPLVGPIVTALLGTFVGAWAVTYMETRSVARSTRVGWGVVLARTIAVVVKVGTGVAIAAAVAVAVLV